MKTSQAVVDQLLDQRQRMVDDIAAGRGVTLCQHVMLREIDDAIMFYRAQERGRYLDNEAAGHA